MCSKWSIFRPPSLLSNSVHRKSLSLFIGVLLIAFFSVAQASNSARLVNISSRCIVKSGVGNTIAGFIIEGGSKTIIIRGLGRGLGLSPNLDVEMEVTKYPSSEFVARNDNWQSDIRAAEIPSHLQLPDATDAGLLLTLPAGAYTAVVKPKGASGIGLVSVDDLDDPQSISRLINISTRCSVEKSDKNAIAGFIIKGTGTQSVLIGALGKGLGLSLNLDTQMALSKYPSGELMESNESWQRHRNAPQIPTHLQLPDPSDAGLLLDLVEGAYTAVVKPTGEIGIGLVAVNAISSGSPPPSTPKYSSTPASGSTLNFGSTPVGTPVSSDLIISEAGNADLVLNSSRISGTNANDFRVLTAFPLTLPDNAVYIQAPTITVQCTPSGENLRIASLQISTNEGTHSYPLECTGSNGCPTSQSTTCPVLNNLSPPSEDLIPWLGAGVDSDRNWLKQEECLDGVITPLGKSVTDLSANLISNFKDVLEIQKMSAGGKLSIKFFKAHANANYEKMFRQTSYMQSYVLNYNVDLGSERIGNISISERGKIAAQNACDFRRYCGDKYVSEVTKGGKVYVEMNFKFKTTQQKTEFSAGGGFGFAGEICCVPFSIDLEASVSRLSQTTRKESSLEVVAHQEGGKVEDLIKIFGSNGNSTSCSLDDLAPCKKAIDDIIAYVQDGFAETLRDYPSVSKYKYSGFDYVIGVPDLVSDVTPEIEQAREALA
ncbi:MAG: hypothetical protein VSS75_004975, partial [Candidatus Parabeggiatoa sp.]|nr:hypothetical protein [Candidatus Parabeggiatoa sp.]